MKITATRDKLYPCVARPGPAWQWIYSYRIDDQPAVTYGTHAASFRGMLRRNFPDATVVFEWQQR